MEYIENKLNEYKHAMAENDGDNNDQLEQEIKKQNKRKKEYKKIEKQLNETGEHQISTSDRNSDVLKELFFHEIFRKTIFKPALNRLYLNYKMNINGSF